MREVDLLLEALDDARVGGGLGTNGFERDSAAELLVFCFVDGAHAALANQADDFEAIGDELIAVEERQRR